MSHFSVAVITKGLPTEDDIEQIMAPYQENNMGDVSLEYLEFESIDDDELDDCKNSYGETCSTQTFQEYMQEQGYSYDRKTNKYGYYSNPNSTWDWYQIGGRWAGMLQIRKNGSPLHQNGELSWVWKNKNPYKSDNTEVIKCDSARINDLILPNDSVAKEQARRFWELYVEQQEPQNEAERDLIRHTFFTSQYYLGTYKNKDNYVRCETTFSTYAVITRDGEWHSQGTMGWFGCSVDDDRVQWIDGYKKLVFDSAEEDDYITIVDCHI